MFLFLVRGLKTIYSVERGRVISPNVFLSHVIRGGLKTLDPGNKEMERAPGWTLQSFCTLSNLEQVERLPGSPHSTALKSHFYTTTDTIRQQSTKPVNHNKPVMNLA